jgi:hypothetical protein
MNQGEAGRDEPGRVGREVARGLCETDQGGAGERAREGGPSRGEAKGQAGVG